MMQVRVNAGTTLCFIRHCVWSTRVVLLCKRGGGDGLNNRKGFLDDTKLLLGHKTFTGTQQQCLSCTRSEHPAACALCSSKVQFKHSNQSDSDPGSAGQFVPFLLFAIQDHLCWPINVSQGHHHHLSKFAKAVILSLFPQLTLSYYFRLGQPSARVGGDVHLLPLHDRAAVPVLRQGHRPGLQPTDAQQMPSW